jgi:hypothetical protein
MIFLWTKKDLIGSKIIRWGMRSDCSHFAFSFLHYFVCESVAGGVHIDWFSDFCERNTIVHALAPKIPLTTDEELEIIHPVLEEIHGEPYDYEAMAYFAIRSLRNRLFGTPLPYFNKWDNKKAFFCVEAAGAMKKALKELFDIDLSRVNLNITDPHSLYEIMSRSKSLYEIKVG